MADRGFRDRREAGRLLAGELDELAGREDLLVLALPRGGVPVAFEVARALGAPLDVFTVRKLGVPGQEELAAGAIATGGVRVINRDVADTLGLAHRDLDEVAEREERELRRREESYRGNRPPPAIAGRTVILVDDGLATGATMRAAVEAARRQGPEAVIVAVPVGGDDTCRLLEKEADRVVCTLRPRRMQAIGMWYEDFGQTSDEEVRELLGAAGS